jgi:PhoPQ-activated pathogenicity-related protein
VPNADHSLRGSDAGDSILAFYQAILQKQPLPKFSWTMAADGSIQVRADDKPAAVNVWQATNPTARDFRLVTIGPAYTKSRLEPTGENTYLARVSKPAKGWTAFFVELVFDRGGSVPLKFTTQVSVVPDVLPHRIEELQKGSK